MRWWKGPSLLDSVCQLRAKPKMRQADGPPVVCFSRAVKIGGVGTVFVGMVLRGTLRQGDRAVIFPVRLQRHRQILSFAFVVFVPSLSSQNRCMQRFTGKLKTITITCWVCRGVLRRSSSRSNAFTKTSVRLAQVPAPCTFYQIRTGWSPHSERSDLKVDTGIMCPCGTGMMVGIAIHNVSVSAFGRGYRGFLLGNGQTGNRLVQQPGA